MEKQNLADLEAVVDRTDWREPKYREAALASLVELDALEKKLRIRPGRPGCIDKQVKEAAALLGLDAELFSGLLDSAVCNLTDPKDSFEFEILADRSKKGGR